MLSLDDDTSRATHWALSTRDLKLGSFQNQGPILVLPNSRCRSRVSFKKDP